MATDDNDPKPARPSTWEMVLEVCKERTYESLKKLGRNEAQLAAYMAAKDEVGIAVRGLRSDHCRLGSA